MNTQQIASILRQVVAVAAVVMGALTASLSSIHLPAAVSSVLVVAGAVILAVEHYLGGSPAGVARAEAKQRDAINHKLGNTGQHAAP